MKYCVEQEIPPLVHKILLDHKITTENIGDCLGNAVFQEKLLNMGVVMGDLRKLLKHFAADAPTKGTTQAHGTELPTGDAPTGDATAPE